MFGWCVLRFLVRLDDSDMIVVVFSFGNIWIFTDSYSGNSVLFLLAGSIS